MLTTNVNCGDKRVNVSARIWNLMQNEGLTSLEDFERYTRYELLLFPHIGKKSVDELEALLAEHGLALISTPSVEPFTVPVYRADAKPRSP